MKKVAINGLGRIGRLALRHYLLERPKHFEIVAANDLTPGDEMAYLIRYDSVHWRAPFPVSAGEGTLSFGDTTIKLFAEKDPAKLPWKELGVDYVIECTGRFTKKEAASKHIEAGAERVIVSAPSGDADITIVLGVNEKEYDSAKHVVVSNASCTTNSIAPVIKVLDDAFGVDYFMATTIHAYTATQSVVDTPVGDKRRGRAAALSLIPSTSGAAKAMIPLFPHLKGKMDIMAVRAPVPDGSLSDLCIRFTSDVSAEKINGVLKKAAEGHLNGIVDFAEDEIVSADIVTDPHSGIVDSTCTKVILDRVAKVMVWYDNEYGYARRLLDLADMMIEKE